MVMFSPISLRFPRAFTSVTSGFSLSRTDGQHVKVWVMNIACDTDADMEATKQTAAGDGLVVLAAAPFDLGDLEPFGLFEWLGLHDPSLMLQYVLFSTCTI